MNKKEILTQFRFDSIFFLYLPDCEKSASNDQQNMYENVCVSSTNTNTTTSSTDLSDFISNSSTSTSGNNTATTNTNSSSNNNSSNNSNQLNGQDNFPASNATNASGEYKHSTKYSLKRKK
jgi:hypothetical protein